MDLICVLPVRRAADVGRDESRFVGPCVHWRSLCRDYAGVQAALNLIVEVVCKE